MGAVVDSGSLDWTCLGRARLLGSGSRRHAWVLWEAALGLGERPRNLGWHPEAQGRQAVRTGTTPWIECTWPVTCELSTNYGAGMKEHG